MRRFAGFAALGILLCGGIVAIAQQNNTRGSGPCDRACLEGFVDQYLDAVIAHDPKRLPLAPNAKFTENGQRLNVGDGFWRSTLSKGNYKLFVTDVEAGQMSGCQGGIDLAHIAVSMHQFPDTAATGQLIIAHHSP